MTPGSVTPSCACFSAGTRNTGATAAPSSTASAIRPTRPSPSAQGVLLLLPASGDDLERGAALADRAVAAGPKHPYYAYFMATKGLAEYRRGRFDAAIEALQQAGARGVWMPVTRLVLAMALHRSGRTREARETLAAAIQSYDWNEANADFHDKWIAHILRREAEELITPNLSAFLKGEYQPKDNSERLELIDPCRFRKRYLSASRLYADALAAEPNLADDALSGNRYNAACSAARTGCSQGEDAKDLDAKECARWRKQALDWLRIDLDIRAKQLDGHKPEDHQAVAAMLQHWQQDSDHWPACVTRRSWPICRPATRRRARNSGPTSRRCWTKPMGKGEISNSLACTLRIGRISLSRRGVLMNRPDDPNHTVDETPRPNPLTGSPVPQEAAASARLELLEEIARGSMGAVLRGRDADIGRDVAVKVLLEAHCGKPEPARRFLEEARIAGRLQHPGVAPVYALGRLPDGRPFFTMKLIKGRTLTALLTERIDLAAGRPRFLRIFEQVCQTLAYAHARGVIHRDLKPSNVMVGAYGEVQVMDWGLAKVLPRPGEAVEARRETAATEATSVIQTPRVDSDTGEVSGETQAGSVLGTPAYMAPEQARGEVEDVDRRSDVFGLGAILCEVLTGRPPFVGSGAAAQKQAARGDLADAFARLDDCGADAELIELARRCLSADPASRPGDAGEASAAVTAYRESVERRLREAEVANAEAKVKAVEGRKRRRVALALATSVLLAAAGAAAGAFWYHAEQTRRAAATERDVTAALAEAAALGNQGATLKDDPAKWEVALTEGMSAVKRAEGVLNSGEGTDELRRRVASARADLESAEKDRRMIVRLEEARLRIADPDANASGFDIAGSAVLFAAAFKDYMGLDLQRFDQQESAADIIGRDIGKELLAGLDDWLFVERAEDRHMLIRSILRAADPDASSFRNRLNAAVQANDRKTLTAMATGDQERELSPGNLLRLARALNALGAETEALKLLRAGQSRYPALLWINFDLAQHLQRARPPAYEEAIRFYTVAAALHPGSTGIYTNLGLVLGNKGDLDGAAACFRRVIEIDPKLAQVHGSLGLVLQAKADLEGAAACFRRAIELDPKSAAAHNNLGGLLGSKGDLEGAAACFRRAIELNPKGAGAHNNLGLVLESKGHHDVAAACFRRAIEIEPMNAGARMELVKVLAPVGRLEEARAAWAAALGHDPPSHDAWFGYAELCLFLGQDEEYRRSCHALLARFGDTADPAVAERVGRVLLLPASSEELERGAALVDRAVAAGPTHPYYSWFLATKGLADYRRGRFDAAIDALQQAGARGVAMPATGPVLAMALYRSGRTQQAREALAAAIRSYDWEDGKAVEQNAWTGHILRREAEELIPPNLSAFLKGEYQPKDNSERLELFDSCRFRKRYLSASRLYADALAADPKLADDALSSNRYNAACSAARAGCGQGEDAKDLDVKERTRWHKQALDWLRADLDLRAKQLDGDKPEERQAAAATLQHWQQDSDLAGLRDAAELAKLPADEQEACKKLWADVHAVLDKADAKK